MNFFSLEPQVTRSFTTRTKHNVAVTWLVWVSPFLYRSVYFGWFMTNKVLLKWHFYYSGKSKKFCFCWKRNLFPALRSYEKYFFNSIQLSQGQHRATLKDQPSSINVHHFNVIVLNQGTVDQPTAKWYLNCHTSDSSVTNTLTH